MTPPSYPRRPWTADEEQRAIELIQAGRSWPHIERTLTRSRESIQVQLRKQGISIRVIRAEPGGCRCIQDVATLLGVERKTARRWARQGDLSFIRTGCARYVTDDTLMLFMERRDIWPEWKPERIPDADWRAYAETLRASAGGRWLTMADIARRYHVSHAAAMAWARAGRLPGLHRRGPYYHVWSADLDGWQPPYATADYTAANHRGWVTRRQRQQEHTV